MFEKLRLIDLSVPLQGGAVSEPRPARIHYIDHHTDGLEQMQQLFGVLPDDLTYSGGLGWAVEEVLAITHTGTHVDAPFHYGPLSGGKPARRIDEVPLEWCFCDAPSRSPIKPSGTHWQASAISLRDVPPENPSAERARLDQL